MTLAVKINLESIKFVIAAYIEFCKLKQKKYKKKNQLSYNTDNFIFFIEGKS